VSAPARGLGRPCAGAHLAGLRRICREWGLLGAFWPRL